MKILLARRELTFTDCLVLVVIGAIGFGVAVAWVMQ